MTLVGHRHTNFAKNRQNNKGRAEVAPEGPYTSWWHMFGWNVFGLPLMGPAVATWRFFDTLNKIERKLNG